LPAGASVVVILAAGWYSQRLLARGVSSRVARGLLGGGCVALGGLALAVMPYVPGIPAKIALATIGIAVPSVINVISHTVVSELTPVAQRGALLAFGTAIATSAGLLAPYVMGSVVETAATPLAGFNTGFMICGVVMLVGGLIGMALIRPERDALRWTNPIAVAAAGPAGAIGPRPVSVPADERAAVIAGAGVGWIAQIICSEDLRDHTTAERLN